MWIYTYLFRLTFGVLSKENSYPEHGVSNDVKMRVTELWLWDADAIMGSLRALIEVLGAYILIWVEILWYDNSN